MNDKFARITRNISYTEIECIKSLHDRMDGAEEMAVITSHLTDKLGITRSVMVNALRLLDVAGVLEARSMGVKGTRVKVLDQEVFSLVANM